MPPTSRPAESISRVPKGATSITNTRPFDYSRFDRLAAVDSDDDAPLAKGSLPSQSTVNPTKLPKLHLVLGDLASAKVQWCYETWGTGYHDLTVPWGAHVWSALGVLDHAVRTVQPDSRDSWTASFPRLPALITPDVPPKQQQPNAPKIDTTRALLAQSGILATTPEIQLHLYARALFGAQHRRVLPDRPDRAQLALEIDEISDTKLRPHCQTVYWHVIMSTNITKRTYARAIHMPRHKAIWEAFLAPVFPCPTEDSAKSAVDKVRKVLDEVHAKIDMLNPVSGKDEPVPSLVDVQRPVPTAVDAGLAIYLAPIVCAVVPPHAVPSNSIACLPLPDPEEFPAWLKAEARDLIRTHPLAKWAAAYMSKLDTASGAVCGNGKSGTARGVKPSRYGRAARPQWTQWGAGLMRLFGAGVALLWLLVLTTAAVLPPTRLASVVAVMSVSLLGTAALGLSSRSPHLMSVETRMRIALLLKIIQDAITDAAKLDGLKGKATAKNKEAGGSSMKKSDSGSRLNEIIE